MLRSISIRTVLMTVAAGAALTLTGCASTGDLNQLRAQVQHAQQTADQAQQTANAAQTTANAAKQTAEQAKQTAQDTNQRIDRMFKKSMRK